MVVVVAIGITMTSTVVEEPSPALFWVFVHKQHSIHCDTNLGEVRVPRLHTIEVGLEPQPIGKILLTWRTFLLFIIEGNELNF